MARERFNASKVVAETKQANEVADERRTRKKVMIVLGTLEFIILATILGLLIYAIVQFTYSPFNEWLSYLSTRKHGPYYKENCTKRDDDTPDLCSLWTLGGVLSSVSSTLEDAADQLEGIVPQTLDWVGEQTNDEKPGIAKSMKAFTDLVPQMIKWAWEDKDNSLKARIGKSVENIEDASQNMADASGQLKDATNNFGSPSAPSAPDGDGMMASSTLGGGDDGGGSNNGGGGGGGGTYTGTGFSNPLSRRLRFRRR